MMSSKFKTQNLKFVLVANALLFAFALNAEAQPSKKIPRIGYLTVPSLSANTDRIEAFRSGLRGLGYVEGKNIVIDWRSAEGKPQRQPELAAELVRRGVDVIVTSGPTMTRAAKEATGTIPIVMAQDNDPVSAGFVVSLARPGGNITGVSSLAPEISGKRLELLKEVVPRLFRVAVFGDSNEPGNSTSLRETEAAAGVFGAQLQVLDVLSAKEIETAFRNATQGHADALLVLPSAIHADYRGQIANLALKNRLPSIYYSRQFVELGGLISYSASFTDLSRRAAYYVDKILKGVKPADLPVEQPTKFELAINLKAAKQIGLTIPPNVLARADRVVK
ncbi:MAG TPA: ABC transporter substrate-binding protein [Candidatus Binatia bacterium]|jgi:putative ABC transport system substrate-binding protein